MLRKCLYLSCALIAVSAAQAAPALAESFGTIHYRMPSRDEAWQREQLRPAPESKMGDWRAELRRHVQFETPVNGASIIINSKVRLKIRF